MSSVEQLIDHAAELQQQIDQLWAELLYAWLAVLGLALLLALLAYQTARER